jgi:hypothetical protein
MADQSSPIDTTTLTPESMLNQILFNLIDAGVVSPAQKESTRMKLINLPFEDLCKWLVESHCCREMAQSIVLRSEN